MGTVKVFCKDEGKIEELLKYLLEEGIPFDIVGKQALLLLNRGDFERLTNAEGGWFDIEHVEDFPSVCWPANKVPFGRPASVPDHFKPVSIPTQQKRPSRR